MSIRYNTHNQAIFTCRTRITALPGHPATRNKTARPPRCVLCVLQTLVLRTTVLRPPSTPRAVLRKDAIVGHLWIMAALDAGLEGRRGSLSPETGAPSPWTPATCRTRTPTQRWRSRTEPARHPHAAPKHTQTHTSATAGETGREVSVVTT